MVGNILLTIGLLASVFSLTMYYFSLRGYSNTQKLARGGFHIMAISVIAASALLLNAIITHQYQYKYVFSYSGDDLPFGLLMSTFYAGQEGSFLLWAFFAVIVGLILLEYTSKRDGLENRVMLIYTLATAFLLVMVSPLLKSPFTYIWADPTFVDVGKINPSYIGLPFLKGFLYGDPGSNQNFVKIDSQLVGMLEAQGIAFSSFLIKGKGLNPLLQNFWMQIHPPLLFVGFAMAAVPFSFALSALIKNEYVDWIKQSFPWVIAGMMVLGLAIMLGGYWAYGVLGWGGYWGWDPVENSSLVPWIIGVASIHTLLIQKKTQASGGAGRFVKTNLILCILTYVLVIYSTFLTRSGILGDSSVHSFVDPGMLAYTLLVIFILTFIVIGFGAIAYRWKYLEKTFQGEDNLLSRELALFTGAVTLIASAIIIIVGTSTPIFGRAVEISFYNELNLPIGIILGVINGLSLILKWQQNKGMDFLKRTGNFLIVSLVLTLVIVLIAGMKEIMLILFTLSALFTIVVNTEVAFRVIKKQPIKLGAAVSHIGFAIMLLGVIATGGYTKDQQIDLVKGETKSVLGYDLTFTGFNLIEDGKKYAFNIEVDKGTNSFAVAPVMYIAEFNNSLMREPDIYNSLTKDFYISPLSYNDGRNKEHSSGESVTLTKGSKTIYNEYAVTFTGFNFPAEAMAMMQEGKEFYIGAFLMVEKAGEAYKAVPRMIADKGAKNFTTVEIKEADMRITLTNLDASGKIVITLDTISGNHDGHIHEPIEPKEILSIEASIKPFIMLVWLGVALTTFGFLISTIRRTKESKV